MGGSGDGGTLEDTATQTPENPRVVDHCPFKGCVYNPYHLNRDKHRHYLLLTHSQIHTVRTCVTQTCWLARTHLCDVVHNEDTWERERERPKQIKQKTPNKNEMIRCV